MRKLELVEKKNQGIQSLTIFPWASLHYEVGFIFDSLY